MADGRDFGTLINERRLALGYSLGQLANRVRTTASEVRAWERGHRAPAEEVLGKLAAELELDPDELMVAARGVDGDRADVEEPADSEAAAAVMTPVFSDGADTGSAEDQEVEQPEPSVEDAGSGDVADAPAGEPEPPQELDDAAQDPSGGNEEPEPTAEVAGGADDVGAATDGGREVGHDAEAGPEDDAPTATEGPGALDEATRLADLPTEAVPVVSAPAAVAVEEVVAVQAPSHPIPQTPAPPSRPGVLDPVTSFLRVLFDPDRRYLFWVRTVLMLVVFIVFFRVLAWAVPAFFDTLRDILDTIESTTTDTTLVPGG